MQQTISITEKWQVNIPKRIRESLGLKRHGKAIVRVENKKIVIEPIQSSLMKMAGKYSKVKLSGKININKIRDYIDYSEW